MTETFRRVKLAWSVLRGKHKCIPYPVYTVTPSYASGAYSPYDQNISWTYKGTVA